MKPSQTITSALLVKKSHALHVAHEVQVTVPEQRMALLDLAVALGLFFAHAEQTPPGGFRFPGGVGRILLPVPSKA